MLYFFTQTHIEAAPAIRRYGMKRLMDVKQREVFRSNNAVLAVCGAGPVGVAAAVAQVLQMLGATAEDTVIALGACVSQAGFVAGDIVLCRKLTDMTTGRDHYPDMLYKHPFKEGSLVTRVHETDDGVLADNFGAFVYQAALFFVPCHSVHVVKLIYEYKAEFDGLFTPLADWLESCADREKMFSHIYVEDAARAYPIVNNILAGFPNAGVIGINHYKDVFCKKGQDYAEQKNSPKLILAVNNDAKLHTGSVNCDSYGHENFFYSTHVMNCPYDCEYCYLQGMYRSANVVIFVNIEDTLAEVDAMRSRRELYVCISYDGDMLALEGLTGFIRRWIGFVRDNGGIQIELRTRSAAFAVIRDIPAARNVILSWSLSPQEFIDRFEPRTPSLKARMDAAEEAIRLGWRVRVCVDPMLIAEGYERIYEDFFMLIKERFFDRGEGNRPEGLSIGVFRAPVKYIRKIRALRPDSEIMRYNFVEGTYSDADRTALYKNVDRIISKCYNCVTNYCN